MFDAITIYQTVSAKYDISKTEQNGPIECEDADNLDWLGPGFYFWDSHVELAHEWGEQMYVRKRNQDYYICKSSCVLDQRCYDLHESGAKRIEFENYAKQTSKKLNVPFRNILVRDIFVFLRSRPEWSSRFNAIRILGNGSFSNLMRDKSVRYFQYNNRKAVYLKFPAVQFCFFDLDSQSLNGYKVVHKSNECDQIWA